MNGIFVPRDRSVGIALSVPAGEAAEAVLSFESLGLSPGGNLAIEMRDVNDRILWSYGCVEPFAFVRRNSIKARIISVIRRQAIGLLAECVVRKILSIGLPRFCHELPIHDLPIGGTVRFFFRRQLAPAVLIKNVRLQIGALLPSELIETTDAIAAFVEGCSFRPGDSVALRLHSYESIVHVEMVRYGLPVASLLLEQNVSGGPHVRPRAGFCEMPDYPIVWRAHLSDDSVSGLYGLRITTQAGDAQTVPFIVRSSVCSASILVIASTNTWCAYNEWGGASAYYWRNEQSLGRLRSEILTKARPNPFADPDRGAPHLTRSLRLLLEWLTEQGFVYDVATDDDFHANPSLLLKYRCVMFDAHPEYWSEKMRGGLEDYLNAAGRVIYMGGNGFYWRAEPAGDLIRIIKPSGAFPDGARGGLWGEMGRPESAILGIAYTPAGAATFAPFMVCDAKHWVFEGCGVENGDLLGVQGEFGAASGHETDKIDYFTPRNVSRIAKGLNPRDSGADMIFLEHPSGGQVFAAGSITFVGALAQDARLSCALRNVLSRFSSEHR